MPSVNDAMTADQRSPATSPPNDVAARPRAFGLIAGPSGPDAPTARDRAGAQGGMIIVLLVSAAFWLTVAAVAMLLAS
jgi:hypothetical protein